MKKYKRRNLNLIVELHNTEFRHIYNAIQWCTDNAQGWKTKCARSKFLKSTSYQIEDYYNLLNDGEIIHCYLDNCIIEKTTFEFHNKDDCMMFKLLWG
jgi:hypothetical protein